MVFVILFIVLLLLILFPLRIHTNLHYDSIINITSNKKYKTRVIFALYGYDICTSYVNTAYQNGFISVAKLIADNGYSGNHMLTFVTFGSLN